MQQELLESIIRRVLDSTYQYWDGYYLPDPYADEDGWTEDKIVAGVMEDILPEFQ